VLIVGLAALARSLFGEEGDEDIYGAIELRSAGYRIGNGVARDSYWRSALRIRT
jgi:hypothetical protein